MKTFLVGGAVRDKLMGIPPKDLDYVVVGGSAEQMLKLGFIQVGADFPVFLDPQHNHEYALARTERKTGKGYLGFEVETQNVTLCDDLARRDLTINSMAMDDEGSLFDPYGGQHDMEARVLRHTSDSFVEDPLRVLRLARFHARYNFHIADETFELSKKMVARGDLNELPVERFWGEMHKVFLESRPDLFFKIMRQLDCDLHIKFFQDVYGNFFENDFLIKPTALAVGFARPEDRVRLHVALTGKPNAVLHHAEGRTRALHTNVQRLRAMKLTPSGIFDLLKHAKAWSEGPGVEDLWKAIVFGVDAGQTFPMTKQQLRLAVAATQTITSHHYLSEFTGKELGLAIERGRTLAIAKALNLQDDDPSEQNKL